MKKINLISIPTKTEDMLNNNKDVIKYIKIFNTCEKRYNTEPEAKS